MYIERVLNPDATHLIKPNVVWLQVAVNRHECRIRRLVQVLKGTREGERVVEDLAVAVETRSR